MQPVQYSTGLRFNKIIAGLLLIAATQKTFAKKVNFPVHIVSIVKNEKLGELKTNDNPNEKSTIDSSKNIIHGKVRDGNTKDFLPSAVVKIKNSNIGVNTDSKGNFKIIIPDTLLSRKIVLQITYIGYEASEITINKKDLPLITDFALLPSKFVMGEVVVVGYKH